MLIDNFLFLLADKKYDLIKEKLNIDESTVSKYRINLGYKSSSERKISI